MWGLARRAIMPITLTVSLLTAAGAAPAGSPMARSGEALTESEAVRLGLAEGAFIQIQEARVDLARSELVDARVVQAAERTAVPDVTVGLGAKQISDRDGDGWGLVLGVAVPLPLFDRGQGAVARADAESRVAAGEYRIALREAEMRALALALEARLATIELERISGGADR